MDYISHSPAQIRQMLDAIGKPDLDSLFSDLPASIRLTNPLDLPKGCTEQEIRRKFARILSKNKVAPESAVSYLGAGAYDHYIPEVIDALVSRGEYLTAYTPYQAEMSQGLLQSIFEFQELIAHVTGMDVSNASLYDAGTAVAEAAKMAFNIQGKMVFLLPDGLHPQYREILNTYNIAGKMEFRKIETKLGAITPESLDGKLDDSVAAVIVQQPDYFGCIQDLEMVAERAHSKGALLIVAWYPIAAGFLKTPGACGADIVVGDGQPLGIPLSFGGPYLGFIGTRKKFIHNLAGRIVGKSVDSEGKEAYVLTLQAREQHIKREKASSNICSNQALAALRAAIYLSLMGESGLRQVAITSFNRAHSLHEALTKTGTVKAVFPQPFFNEFSVSFGTDSRRDRILNELEKQDVFLGVKLDGIQGGLLMAATEKNTMEQQEKVVSLLAKAGA